MTRAFDAPRALVFDAFTKPELIRRWMLGPDGWSMPVCEVDLRVGGPAPDRIAFPTFLERPHGPPTTASLPRAPARSRRAWVTRA